MTFILRHPLVEDQFLSFYADSAEDTPIAAGKLVYLVGDRIVDVVSNSSAQYPVGWLMQKVKAAYTNMPADFQMRSDLGSSDAFLGDPVAVAHGPGAVYETDQYVDESADGIAYGTRLSCDDDGKLSDSNADSAVDGPHAMALCSLTAAQCTAGNMLLIKALV